MNTGVGVAIAFSRSGGCHCLLQGILPTQGSNVSLPHCRQTLYCLSHQRNSTLKEFYFTQGLIDFPSLIKSNLDTLIKITLGKTGTIILVTSLVAQMVKRLPAMRETWVQSVGREDLLEKEMATHSSTLAWRIPWTEEPGRLQSMGSQRVGHN